MSDLEAAVLVVTWITILLIALGLGGAIRQVMRLTVVLEELRREDARRRPGVSQPVLSDLLAHAPIKDHLVALFVDPSSPAGKNVLPALAVACRRYTAEATFACVLKGDEATLAEIRHDLDELIVLPNRVEAFNDPSIVALPYVMVIDSLGVAEQAMPVGSPAQLNVVLDRVLQVERSMPDDARV